MNRRVLCNALQESRWKELRRYLVTASQMCTYLDVHKPKFFKESAEDIIQMKLDDTEIEFSVSARSSILHGRLTEDLNREKASRLFGIPLAPFNVLVWNPRWPHLGASLDALGLADWLYEPDWELCKSYPPENYWKTFETLTRCERTRSALEAWSGNVVFELKNSDAGLTFHRKGEPREWIDQPPGYYLPQVWTQMSISEIPRSVLACQFGATNFTGYAIAENDSWGEMLDKAEAQARIDLEPLYAERGITSVLELL